MVWQRQFGTPGADSASDLIVSDDGAQVFVVGFVSGGTVASQVPLGGRDILVTKYDADGDRVWERQLGTAGADEATALAPDASWSNVYVVGYVSGALELGGEHTSHAGGMDVVLLKYNTGGDLVWARQLGTNAKDNANAVAFHQGHVYTAGTTEGEMDGQDYAGATDLFLAKHDADGDKVYVMQACRFRTASKVPAPT